jgi:hypothetical protein
MFQKNWSERVSTLPKMKNKPGAYALIREERRGCRRVSFVKIFEETSDREFAIPPGDWIMRKIHDESHVNASRASFYAA